MSNFGAKEARELTDRMKSKIDTDSDILNTFLSEIKTIAAEGKDHWNIREGVFGEKKNFYFYDARHYDGSYTEELIEMFSEEFTEILKKLKDLGFSVDTRGKYTSVKW